MTTEKRVSAPLKDRIMNYMKSNPTISVESLYISLKEKSRKNIVDTLKSMELEGLVQKIIIGDEIIYLLIHKS